MSMIFRAIDPATGDWSFGNGLGSYLTDEKAIEVNIATAIRSFYNDAFWNATFGIDWINLLGTRNTQATIKIQLTNLLSNCYGVVKVNSVSTSLSSSRNLSLTYNINTIYSISVTNSVNVLN